MSKSILHDLYYGEISPWERKATRSSECSAVNQKIEAEKQHFIGKMSLDDCARFQALENLFTQANDFEQLDAFLYGMRFGTMFICAIFADDNN